MTRRAEAAAHREVSRAPLSDARSTTDTLFRPGVNCWRVDRADRFRCVQDAAEYFALVRDAMLAAQRTVFILGWDILATVDLLPEGSEEYFPWATPRAEAPTRLDHLLAYIARRRPRLRCYILIWDYAALYTLERDPFSRWRLGWRMPRHVRFGFDDRHPVGGSHHQKVVVVDDSLGFCGGIDLTGHRWDTSTHRIEEPARTSRGRPYEPYHEVQAMVDGPSAAGLGVLARDRWRALGEERMPPVGRDGGDLWPSSVEADLTDVDVAISRTVPATEGRPAVRECESLFLDSIDAAKQSIYIESQYFTNDTLGHRLAERLRTPDGPEMVIVIPRECHGWLERNTMGAFRDSVCRELLAADRYRRLRIVYPAASRALNVPTFIHSKVMIVDDWLLRIGSANVSRRSMGVDTECDMTVDASGRRDVRSGIVHMRNRLLGEHLGLDVDAVANGIAGAGSLRAFVDSRADGDRTLARVDIDPAGETPPDALRAAADPDAPKSFDAAVAEFVPADTTNRARPLRLVVIPTLVVLVVLVGLSSAVARQPEFQGFQEALFTLPTRPFAVWAGVLAFVLANLALIPLEVVTIVTGMLLGGLRGTAVALLGSLIAAVIGYTVGRSIGASGVARWVSRRAYRSGRQFGARGLAGVIGLRLASIASAGAIHLLCGAGRIPFGTYMTGTLIGLLPALAVLTSLGALVRRTLLEPSAWNAAMTLMAALLIIIAAAAVRALLLFRRLAPSVGQHRERAEYG